MRLPPEPTRRRISPTGGPGSRRQPAPRRGTPPRVDRRWSSTATAVERSALGHAGSIGSRCADQKSPLSFRRANPDDHLFYAPPEARARHPSTTIVLFAVGGLVRGTDSGLGCSTWPECDPGRLFPTGPRIPGSSTRTARWRSSSILIDGAHRPGGVRGTRRTPVRAGRPSPRSRSCSPRRCSAASSSRPSSTLVGHRPLRRRAAADRRRAYVAAASLSVRGAAAGRDHGRAPSRGSRSSRRPSVGTAALVGTYVRAERRGSRSPTGR